MTYTTKTHTVDARTARPEAARAGRSRPGAVATAVAAPLVLWAIAEWVVGIELRAPASAGGAPVDIGPAMIAVGATLPSLAGWGLLAALERTMARARNVWLASALIVLLVSLVPLSGSGITAASRTVLVLMHLVVAGALIPTLYRSSPTHAR